jgi:hypothetical protein
MSKKRLQRWVWFVAGVWCWTLCASAQELKPVTISIHTEEPTNLYYDVDTVALQSAIIVYVTIENKAVSDFKGVYDYDITDAWGERVGRSRRSVSFNLAQGERMVRKELFQVSKRGAFLFTAQVRGGKESITQTLPFAVIPKPKGAPPDSFFGVRANVDDAQAIAFLQRMGASISRVAKGQMNRAENTTPVSSSPNLRASGFARSVDRRVQLVKRFGGGRPLTIEVGEMTGSLEDRRAAANLVAQHVVAALAGVYRVEMRQGTMGAEQLREAAAYATMISMLDGRAPVWDVFPSAPNLWGAVFASPAIVDPEMRIPRKDAISTRWKTTSDPKDETRVAVLWTYTGTSARDVDKGTLIIEDGEGIDALDLFGNPIGERRKTRLSVPLGESPVYLTARLPIQAFAERVASARLENLTPIALQILPLTEPPDRAQQVVVRVQNQLNRPIGGTLALNLPIGWSVQPPKSPFALEMGEVKDIAFELAGAVANRDNVYPISVTAEVEKKKYERAQLVQVAAAVYGAAQVDGDLSDWADAYPLSLDSAPQTYSEAYARSLMNPKGKRFESSPSRRQISARLYTKWDEQFFYVAAEVAEPELAQAATADPRTGNKDFWNGDALQLAFSLNDRARDDNRAAADAWRWKGVFRDSEFGFVLMQAKDGPAVVRLFAPGTPFRVHSAAEPAAGYGIVKGARIVVRRNDAESKTYYEAAIPLSEIQGLRPQDGLRVRLSFVLHNNEGIRSGRLQWSEVAGVWDDLNNVGSFLPTDEPFLPCQTAWGFVGAVAR